MKTFTPRWLALLAALLLGLSTSDAGTITSNLFYDDTAGPNSGGNVTSAFYDYNTGTLTDPDTGVEFEATVRIAAPSGFNLRTNGGTGNREWGVRDAAGTNNSAIDAAGESITAALQGGINVTNFNGLDPGNVSVSFDGFTNVILYFVGNDGDSGRLTDGSSTLFSWNGTLDATENGGDPDSSNDSLIENPTTGQSTGGSPNGSNARIDLSGFLPTTLVAEFKAFDGSGSPSDPNRWRTDDYGVQFTVTVVPEPASSLLAVTLLGVGVVGGRRYR